MKPLSLFSMLAFSLAACSELSASAQEAAPQSVAAAEGTLTVAELFTSQGCSSCPPAEALFAKMAGQANLLTLEWHVDYWDDLVHGGSRWEDVYSSKAFTDRQRAYNAQLRDTRAVYTPQAIINGRLEGVGSRPSAIATMLAKAPDLTVNVKIKNGAVSVSPTGQSASVLYVRLLNEHETDIKGGENKGRKLAGKNIVLEAKILGKTDDNPAIFTLPVTGEGESCAVLVQTIDKTVGPILGAAKC